MNENLKELIDHIYTASDVLEKQEKLNKDHYENDFWSLAIEANSKIKDMVKYHTSLASISTFGKSPDAIRSLVELLEQKGYLVESEIGRLVIKIVESV